MNLHDVNAGITKFKRRRRVGRGTGSGHGKTCGRGHKGAKSRAGYSRHPIFQGGAMPMIRRVPKRGFNNKWALTVVSVNVGDLEKSYEAGEEVNIENLLAKDLISGRFDVLKILGDGELSKSLKITAHRFSGSAKEKIEKAGGEMTEIPGKAPVVKNKQGSAKAK